MKIINVEYAIIGAGTAGLGAYSKISRQTSSLVMVQDGPYGTTCARVGCMPSKLLITAAEQAHSAHTSAFFGIETQVRVDGAAVLQRLRRERDERFVGRNLSYVAKIPAEHKIEGRARFIAPGRLQVDDHTQIHAEKVILTVGSRPIVDPVFTPISSRVLTSDTLFEIEELPESIAVIGLGVVALELGQALHRLGVRTTLFGRSGRIGNLTHAKMQQETRDIFQDELEIYPSGKVVRSWETDTAYIEYLCDDGELLTRAFDRVLVATGRANNLDKLNLQTVGIPAGQNLGAQFDASLLNFAGQPIFVAGDASETLPVWHQAFDEGRAAADNALNYPQMSSVKPRTPLSIYFTDPQIALVGKSYAELEGSEIVVAELGFDSPRHWVWNKPQGRLQVYLERTSGKILGAELLGYQAEHLAHILALAITHEMTAAQILEMPIYHPSAEELLRDILQNAEKQRLALISSFELHQLRQA